MTAADGTNGNDADGVSPEAVLHRVFSLDAAKRRTLVDLRSAEAFMASRLRGSFGIPLEVLVPRMFLLPDRDTPLGLLVAGPPATQMVRGAAGSGGAKEEVQLSAFLASRGWRVEFCIEATPGLWCQAEQAGLLEVGGDPLALLRRWPFKPSMLLMEQADMAEEALARGWVAAGEDSAQGHATASAAGCLGSEPASRGAAVQPGGGPYGVTFRMLDVGCGSGRDLAWLTSRRSTVRVTQPATCSKGCAGSPQAESLVGPPEPVEVAVSWECVGLDSWHGALQRAAEVLSLGEVPAGRGGVTLQLVQIGPGTGELRPLPLPPQGTKGPHPESLLRYLAEAPDPESAQSPHTGGPERTQGSEGEREAGEELTGGQRRVDGPKLQHPAQQLQEKEGERQASPSATPRAAAQPAQAPAAAETAPPEAPPAEAKGGWRAGALRGAGSVADLGLFDLLVCVRFLERSFLPAMAGLLRPGGLILFSTFVDGPGLRAFGRPQGREHVLQRDELARSLFGPEQGFQVLRDDVEAIPDGREVSMFCAQKVATL